MAARRRAVRVYLEAVSRRREAEFLARVAASQKLHRPWLSAPHTREQFRDWVSRSRKPSQACFFVCLLESDELVGVNERSSRLVSRLGFRVEGFSPRYLKIGGRFRDHERWAVLASDWKRRGRRRPAQA